MSFLWALIGYGAGEALGREAGREEGIQEAKRRIDGTPGDGKPVIRRKENRPPPLPPSKWQWISAFVLGALIFGAAWTIDGQIFGPSGNYTLDDYGPGVSDHGLLAFANAMLGFLRILLFLVSFVPLASVAIQWFASQEDEGRNAAFKFKDGDA